MRQSVFKGLFLSSLVCFCICLHVPFDLNGWKALPNLKEKRVVDSMLLAADHLGGTLKEPVTAFLWKENVPDWDLYRVSFLGAFQQNKLHECHADVVWMRNPHNVTVFNLGCMQVNSNSGSYQIGG